MFKITKKLLKFKTEKEKRCPKNQPNTTSQQPALFRFQRESKASLVTMWYNWNS